MYGNPRWGIPVSEVEASIGHGAAACLEGSAIIEGVTGRSPEVRPPPATGAYAQNGVGAAGYQRDILLIKKNQT